MSSVTVGSRLGGPEAWPSRSPDLQLGGLRKTCSPSSPRSTSPISKSPRSKSPRSVSPLSNTSSPCRQSPRAVSPLLSSCLSTSPNATSPHKNGSVPILATTILNFECLVSPQHSSSSNFNNIDVAAGKQTCSGTGTSNINNGSQVENSAMRNGSCCSTSDGIVTSAVVGDDNAQTDDNVSCANVNHSSLVSDKRNNNTDHINQNTNCPAETEANKGEIKECKRVVTQSVSGPDEGKVSGGGVGGDIVEHVAVTSTISGGGSSTGAGSSNGGTESGGSSSAGGGGGTGDGTGDGDGGNNRGSAPREPCRAGESSRSQGPAYDPFNFEARPLTHPQAPSSTTNAASSDSPRRGTVQGQPGAHASGRQRRRCLLLCCCCRCNW